jgi:phosphoserine phosphatase RsbU/P
MQRAITVPARWGSLPALTAFADAIERDEALATDQLYLLRLALEEVVTNLLKYGQAQADDATIGIVCRVDDGALTITIRDHSQPFDPLVLPVPELGDEVTQRTVGGLGIYLLRELADSVSYQHGDDGWNELVIVKYHTRLDTFAFLRHSPLFDSFSDEDLLHLANTAEERELPAGALLFVEDQRGDDCCVLIEGRLDVVKRLGDDEVLLDTRLPGHIVGEMALLDNSPRSATVRAAVPSRVLMLSRDNFYALLTRSPANALELLRGGTARLRGTSQRMIADLQAKNAELTRAYEELQAAQEGLVRLERVRQELAVARRIQSAFLPRTIAQPPGWSIAAHHRFAEEVGGDFYDCIPLPDGVLGLILADVCGKGVPAALFVALARSLLRAASQSPQAFGMPVTTDDALLRAALQLTNRYIAVEHGAAGMFITAFYALLDPQSGWLRFINAGHNGPLLLHRDGTASELEASDIPLGIEAERPFAGGNAVLAPGEALVMFSDGVTEAMNARGELFGDDRLLATLRQHAGASAEQLVQVVLAAVAAFVGDAPPADDLTLLVVSRDV